ncbi:hypothetical protein D3C72_2164860 [compost metagenome]
MVGLPKSQAATTKTGTVGQMTTKADSKHIKPGSAMPALRLRKQDARDIAAFLQTLSRCD